MILDDSTLGKLVLITSGILYLYYTFWIYVLPFADDEDWMTIFFPPIRYALLVPAVIGSLFIGTLVVFTLITFFLSWNRGQIRIVFVIFSTGIMDSNWIIVGIGGATCSGKTTIARELRDRIQDCTLIHQDDFYFPMGSPRLEFIEELQHYNWDTVSAVDFDKLVAEIQSVIR